MENSMSTATDSGSGAIVVSFGSGNRGGRTQASAQGRAGNSNASRNQVSALRSRIRRGGTTGNLRENKERRALLARLDAAANARGNIKRRNLASIANQLQAISNARGR